MQAVTMIDNRPIALYNADKRELIGLFAELIFAVKYLRPDQPQKAYSAMHDALRRVGNVRKNIIFDFPVAVRLATAVQAGELNDRQVIIKNGYPVLGENRLRGYTTSRESFYKKLLEKYKNNQTNGK